MHPKAWSNRGNALLKLQRYEAGLEAITNALKINPNHLEALKGSMSGKYSIRVNDQWRIRFKWEQSNAYDVEIIDYH